MAIDVDPEQDFHVVINGVAQALSLDALAEAYQADAISDETLIWQEGLRDWMRLDTLLAVLSEDDEAPQAPEPAVSAPAPAVDPNAYWVLVAPEEVKSMSLQTLADAHRLGVVKDETLVQVPGGSEWVPLALIIAGFAAQASGSVPPSQAPTQRAPLQHASTQPQLAPAPVAAVAPAQSRPPSAIPSAPNTLAPTAANVGPMSQGVRLNSNQSFALDDSDFPAFQNSKSVWLKRSVIGVGAVAAVFALYLGTSGSTGEAAVQPVGAAASVTPLPSPEVEAEPSAWQKEQALLEAARKKDEVAAKEAASSPAANAFGAHLSGEAAPKNAAALRTKSAGQSKANKTASSSKKTKKSNSQYDPMNGSL